MFSCKQVSNALEKQDYASMPFFKRMMVKFHIATCIICGKYNRQVMIMQDAVRTFRSREEDLLTKPDAPHLSDQDKQAIKSCLRQTK